jgi:hypothetical protein
MFCCIELTLMLAQLRSSESAMRGSPYCLTKASPLMAVTARA